MLFTILGPDISEIPSVKINPDLKPAAERETTSDRVFGNKIETYKPSIRLKNQMGVSSGND